jgi:beta-1,4-mannosyltransferase
VNFDNGLDGSICEDSFFAIKAFAKGYAFGWIEGELRDDSTLTFMDFVRQRARHIQGNTLVVLSKKIPWRFKFILALATFPRYLTPFLVVNLYLSLTNPLTYPLIIELMLSVNTGIFASLYIFGTLKTFLVCGYGTKKSVLFVLITLCLIPLFFLTEAFSVGFALLTNRREFLVCKKAVGKRSSKSD